MISRTESIAPPCRESDVSVVKEVVCDVTALLFEPTTPLKIVHNFAIHTPLELVEISFQPSY